MHLTTLDQKRLLKRKRASFIPEIKVTTEQLTESPQKKQRLKSPRTLEIQTPQIDVTDMTTEGSSPRSMEIETSDTSKSTKNRSTKMKKPESAERLNIPGKKESDTESKAFTLPTRRLRRLSDRVSPRFVTETVEDLF